ncbi:hypothetical protein SAMN04490244_101288 [Tranquillimonas rosea]|uniref:Uncharacterized protein n=2 Tax=Tranquillimonas rosea TaxID=641238 RepID=A0A1H9PRJ6_9RHOB|nr:hypothetical protein SAMN04490244_101288 [Tranquillimonas rosea]
MQFGQKSGVRVGLNCAHWLNWHRSEDFAMICALAGVDVDYMRAFVERELRSPNPGVLFSSRSKRERSSDVARRRSGAAA